MRLWVLLLAVGAMALPALSYEPGPSRTSTGLQTAKPPLEEDGYPAKEAPVDAGARKLLDFLVKEYDLLLAKSKDRVGRSLVIICLSRLPREDVTTRLMEMLENERDPLVKITAWEGVLARVKHLNAEQQARFSLITGLLGKADLFRGELRVPAIKVLATAAPDQSLKATWNTMYLSAHPTHDVAALTALGECAARWKAPEVMDFVLRKAAVNGDEALRASPVLKAAGSSGPELLSSANLKAFVVDHTKWWAGAKQSWKMVTLPDDAARMALAPHYLMSPVDLSTVDIKDKTWYRDLELRAPNLKNFDVGFCVDVTGSMGNAILWLKADVAKMMLAFGTVALEPRIGITFYRDKGDEFVVKNHPLTGRVEDLLNALSKMTADGGGDEPEAVMEGLQECLKTNKWSAAKDARRVVILIGDAPPHAETQAECVRLAARAAELGFKIYAVKCQAEEQALPEFDLITKAGKGATISVGLEELARGRTRSGKLEMADLIDMIDAAEGTKGAVRALPDGTIVGPDGKPVRRAAEKVVPAAAQRPAGQRVVTQVLVDVINPGFKDRVDPLVTILWQLLEDPMKTSSEMRLGVNLVLPKKATTGPVATPKVGVAPTKAVDK